MHTFRPRIEQRARFLQNPLSHLLDGRFDACREPRPRHHVGHLDPPQPITHTGELGTAEDKPAQALGYAQMVDRGVTLRQGQHLLVLDHDDASRRGSGGKGVHQPDVALATPEIQESEHISRSLLDPGRRVAVGRAKVEQATQATADFDAGPIVAHQVVAEAQDEDRRRSAARGVCRHSSTRTMWTEQEMQGS